LKFGITPVRTRPSPPVACAATVKNAMVLLVSKVGLMRLGGWHSRWAILKRGNNMTLKKSIFLLAIIFVCGCASWNPLRKYPDFIQEKELIKNVTLLIDLFIYKSGKNDTLIVDCYNGRRIGAILSDSITMSLIKKGYFINNVIPSSVGRFFKNDFAAK
jgi:hypothetical protein